jgi:hypothetical protein
MRQSAEGWERKTRDLDNGMKQDYDYNKITREEIPVRTYKSKEPTSTQQMLQGGLDPDTVHKAAVETLYDRTRIGLYAPFGMAGKADRDAIANEQTKVSKAAGMTPQDVLRLGVNFKAQSMTMPKLALQRANIDAYEKLARFNGNRILELIGKLDDTSIPLLEAPKRLAERGLIGSDDAAEFLSVLQTYQTEVARIIQSSPNMGGVLTDTARKEIQDVIQKGVTASQAKRIINRLHLEMDVRGFGLDDAMTIAGQKAAPDLPGEPASPTTPLKLTPEGNPVTSFATAEEANAAIKAGRVKSGTSITVAGRPARVP